MRHVAMLKSWKKLDVILSELNPKDQVKLDPDFFALNRRKSGNDAKGCAFFGLNLTKVLKFVPLKGYFRTLARGARGGVECPKPDSLVC